MKIKRCAWVPLDDPEYVQYHDEEWGKPVHDDRTLFEFIVLESAQAGLSWSTILHRRNGYRLLFNQFDPVRVAQMSHSDVERLMKDSRIIRNHAKIQATIVNAQAFCKLVEEYGTFSNYLWGWVDRAPVSNVWKKQGDVPAITQVSILIARDLKKRGFSFMGPTTCYAYMQAVGLVNDHISECFRHSQITAAIHSNQKINLQ